MWEKATGKDEEASSHSRKGRKEEEKEVSIYEIVNTLIAHGHKKEEILHNYSREEMTLFYEKCIKLDMRHNADFIESVIVGVGGAFGGGKKVEKLLAEMRK